MSGPQNPQTLDLLALRERATTGEADAQYALAQALHAQGQLAEAMQWVARAAESGHTFAQYTMGAHALSGAIPLRDMQRGVAFLGQAVAAGLPQACRLMSIARAWGLGGPMEWRAAIDLMVLAASLGEAGALRELGLLWLMRGFDRAQGEAWVAEAARLGDPVALAMVPANAVGTAAPPADWVALRETLYRPDDARMPPVEVVSTTPGIRFLRGFMAPWVCDYVVMRATPLVAPAQIFDEKTRQGIRHPDRNASVVAFWPLLDDLALHWLNRRMAAAAGLPFSHAELLNVMRYEPGQEYRPHFDFFDPLNTDMAALAPDGGQRVRTLLVYLNDGYGDGETCFIRLNSRLKGAKGDALIFDNVDATGAPDRQTLHAGLKVAHGVKWLASKWFRAHPQWG